MLNILAMLRCFGERYIYCDDEQALSDCLMSRDEMIETYSAILEAAKKNFEESENKSLQNRNVDL